MKDTKLERWKRAVVNLECAADSEGIDVRLSRIREQQALFEAGKITPDEFEKVMVAGSRDDRSWGTALFISHAGRRYLLTARHVVWDGKSATREFEQEEKRAQSWPEHMRPELLLAAKARAQCRIFNVIFRVPSFDEMGEKHENNELLMNLGAGPSHTAPYTFSDPSTDLALVSLDHSDSRFADELIKRGFAPIDSSDISGGPETEGQELVTVGFPGSTALLWQIKQDRAASQWAASWYSVPVFAFGHVSMVHRALPFFWADLSVYPGNSGGPVIANDRLVGIVSAQADVAIDAVPAIRTRIPFGRIIKSCFVERLLAEQIEKDSR